jgi:1-acyl-sn-glycerol-3-phosphate acyltransferase
MVVLVLLVGLPLVALTERLHRGWGRSVATVCVRLVGRLAGVAFDLRSEQDLEGRPPVILTPNHSSPMDIPAVLMACPDVRFMAASELFRIPLLSSAMRALDTIPIDRRHPEVARRQLEELVAEDRREVAPGNLVIFPEGGISADGPGRFKSGAFTLAIRTDTPIVPVVIHGSDQVLPPHGNLKVRPGTVVVELLEPIDTGHLSMEDRDELRDRVQRLVTGALERGPGLLPTPR